MRVLKNIGSQVYLYLLWLLASVFLWGWIFTMITDTVPEKKVTIFVDAYALEDKALSIELEKELPEGIRMIRVHPFSYAMFQESTILNADIFIVKASEIGDYIDSFDGAGEKIYDAQSGTGAATQYILYAPEGEVNEDYYLFFGADSLHTGKIDKAAYEVAAHLLKIE